MLANIESTFDEAIGQSQALEKEYAIPQQPTQIKDIQLRIQRVSRLIPVRICLRDYFQWITFRKHRNISIKSIRNELNVMLFSND